MWKTSAPIRRPSANVSAPAGTTMNSCRSSEFCACAPPLIDVQHRHRKHRAPPRRRASGRAGRPASAAAARAAASEHAEDRVRAEPALVRRAVEGDERLVERALVGRVEPGERRRRSRRSRSRPPCATALAAVLGAAVAQLDRLVDARWTRPRAPRRGPARPTRARRPPRRSGSRASRGSAGRARPRSRSLRSLPELLGLVEVPILLRERQARELDPVRGGEPLGGLDTRAESRRSPPAARAPGRRSAAARR